MVPFLHNQNLIIFKYATKQHYSSTMSNVIGLSHKLGKKVGIDLASPMILQMKLYPLHIVVISSMKKLMYEVNNYYPQRHIIVKNMLSKMQLIISFKLNLYPAYTPKIW